MLVYLFEEGSAPLDDIVEWIAARELSGGNGVTNTDHQAAVYTSLYQTHIPELADAAVVVYDAEERRVTLTDRGRRLRPYIEGPENGGSGWGVVFLVESLLWVGVSLAAWSGVRLVSAVPVSWLLAGCLWTFVGTSVAYLLTASRRFGNETGHPNFVD